MAMRFMQIFVPDDDSANIEDLLEGHEVVGTWRDAGATSRIALHLLVDAEETEAIMDRFEHAYGAVAGFRVVLFPVEAVLPRLKLLGEDGTNTNDSGLKNKKQKKESGRVAREELYSDVSEALGISRLFIAMTILSAIVAAVGLLRNDVSVIIGAMVIAPLLGPNVAMSLSATLGDLNLFRHALLTNLVGVTLTIVVSLAIGFVCTVDPETPAIVSRTQLGIGDFALALAAGSAGTFAFTAGVAGAMIGVMVAVALVPPLVTFGILFGAGHYMAAMGALLLVTANVVCINLAGVATFLAQGVRPRTFWEGERAKKASYIAMTAWLLLSVLLGIILYLKEAFGLLRPVLS